MHSLLISSRDKKMAIDYAISMCKKSNIDKIDIDLHSYEKTIGIENIRNFQKKLILKPIKSKVKAAVLAGSNSLTTEAQNALLKILEEPPDNTIIYITTPNKNLMLPTIISRCKVIELKEKITLSEQERLSIEDILVYLESKSIGEKLKLAQDLTKNKEDVITWLEKMIIVTRQLLIERHYKGYNGYNYYNLLKSLQKTHALLKTTNVNKRLALENLFLNL